jgi:glutathione synthase/RimK-type ligase-like ATP-grasp enzyme
MIVVVSYPGEDHSDAVCARLAQAGREVLRLDLADFPARHALALQWQAGQAPKWGVEVDGREVDLQRARVLWWRRVSGFGLDPAIRKEAHRHFAQSETTQAVHGMLDSLPCTWVNPRLADDAAHHKPLQWTVAQQVGLQVPPTLVTTRAEAAREFVAAQRPDQVVFKPFLASIEEWRETRLVGEADLQRLDLLRLAPVIFQRYVPGVDLRITIVGRRLFAAAIDARQTSYPVDMRMVVGEGVNGPAELPAPVQRALLALMDRLGLRYGAVDMRRSDDGEHHFLEVNPAGQWLFAERVSGLPITQAVADYLGELHDLAPGTTAP